MRRQFTGWITLLFVCQWGAKEEKSTVILQDTVLCYQTVEARISIHPEGWERAGPQFHLFITSSPLRLSVPSLSSPLSLPGPGAFSFCQRCFSALGMPAQESINLRLERSVCFWEGAFFFSSFPAAVPGGIAPESLTFTPLDDMIFLKWEEPIEPNGLITQYEVGLPC